MSSPAPDSVFAPTNTSPSSTIYGCAISIRSLPFVPVLQGQSITDYHRCADMYEQRGVDLAALPLVGVGSVCRRQHTVEVERIVRSLAARGYRLHAFGAKVLGLARYADAIASSDSASWSLRGRHVPGCTSTHRSESNCLRFALDWHARLLATLNPPTESQHQPDITQADRSVASASADQHARLQLVTSTRCQPHTSTEYPNGDTKRRAA